MASNWILVADDDLEDQEMVTEVIGQLDNSIEISTASDGREALAKITALSDEKLPALLILDYKMPYMNAGEVLEALAQDNRYSQIPKIVWSTSNREDDVNRCLQAGASRYFVKPSRFSELRTIVRQMLEFCKLSN
jgi:CheY-like chemotaxis protein